MKPLAMFVMLGVAGLYLAAPVAAGALTNGQPPLISRPLAAVSTNNLGLAPFSSAPIVYLDRKTEHPQRLKPGVYQTRPYAIILIVPETGFDDRCVVGASGDISKMPNAKPDVQAVPKTFSQ